jgi:hypothetical protein
MIAVPARNEPATCQTRGRMQNSDIFVTDKVSNAVRSTLVDVPIVPVETRYREVLF